MKKTYIEPSIEMEDMEMEAIICSSQSITSKVVVDDDITYGGVDEEGTLDPASRRHHDIWEDEE